MKKWLVEKIYSEVVTGQDENGNDIIERTFDRYEPKYKVDKPVPARGKEVIYLEGPDLPPNQVKIELDEDGNPSVVEFTEVKEVQAKYVEMDEGIIADSAPVFKTTNRESMLAFVDSFQLRIMAADLYVNDGLLADIAIGEFAIGDPLDTEEKIKSYYKQVLKDLDDKRNLKIADYLQYKAARGL